MLPNKVAVFIVFNIALCLFLIASCYRNVVEDFSYMSFDIASGYSKNFSRIPFWSGSREARLHKKQIQIT